jgi:hypothetical protein
LTIVRVENGETVNDGKHPMKYIFQ